MSRKSVELRERRANIFNQIKDLNAKAEAENRDLNAEETQVFDRGMSDIDRLAADIERMERFEQAERDQAAMGETRGAPADESSTSQTAEQREAASRKRLAAVRHWARTGEVRAEIQPSRERLAELRDTIIGTDSKGGYLLAPVELAAGILKPLNNMVFVRKWCDAQGSITRVTAAKALGIRKRSTRMADANWTTEVAAVTEDTTGAYGRRDLTPTILTKLAKVSLVTLQLSDEAEREITDELAYVNAVTEEKAYMTGTGSAQPLGIFVADANGIPTGRDVTAAGAAAITGDDLINVKYNLKAQYWANAKWALNRTVVKAVRKLKVATTTGGNDLEYVWQPGLTEGAGDRILGHEYGVSEYASGTITTGLYTAVLGDFRYYRIAEVRDMMIQRLTELYAGTNEVGFISRRWIDGAPVLDEAFSRLKQA